MIIFNRKVDDKLKNKNQNTDNDDIINMRKMTLDLGKKILEKKDGIATPVMTTYGNVIDSALKDNPIKIMLFLIKVNELVRTFISNVEQE